MSSKRTGELFCGTKSLSKEAGALGLSTRTMDWSAEFNPDIVADILDISAPILEAEGWGGLDFLWASPPCDAFSVARIGINWTHAHLPKTEKAETGLAILDRTVEIIATLAPKFWVIENPRGKMRKVIAAIFARHGVSDWLQTTVTYCQYGERRMKPTDLWHNIHSWKARPPCGNGDPCHISAPRGSTTGTQGLRGGAVAKAVVPPELCREILSAALAGSSPKPRRQPLLFDER